MRIMMDKWHLCHTQIFTWQKINSLIRHLATAFQKKKIMSRIFWIGSRLWFEKPTKIFVHLLSWIINRYRVDMRCETKKIFSFFNENVNIYVILPMIIWSIVWISSKHYFHQLSVNKFRYSRCKNKLMISSFEWYLWIVNEWICWKTEKFFNFRPTINDNYYG